jgi:4-methylaminobutanoate oxidase (formaldehyde-forming)
MAAELPSRARCVIIGGGVVGCSVAYHLGKLGWKDVVLLERKRLTSGTTWHAAGLIGQLRATANLTKLAKYTAELYRTLEAETGIATGFRQHGSIGVALSEHRLEEWARSASMAKTFGLEVEIVTAKEALAKHPMVEIKDVVGGVWIASDGQCDPANVTLALAKGARNRGVRIIENVKVTGITKKGGRVTGVTTASGAIEADCVVNAAGIWGREVGRLAGVNVPLMACEHFYVVTEPVAGMPKNLPVLRVPDECAYYKEDAGKILLGFFEPRSKPWGVDGIPEDFEFGTLPDDTEHIGPELEKAMRRMPALADTGIHTFFNGPESFTPDNRYILGEAPELRNFYVAAGFNSIGIQSAGGAGKALSEWMQAGEPPFDLGDVDIRRLHGFQGNKTYLAARVGETLGLLYADHFPYRQYASARDLRRSPLHDRLAAHGACFGEAAGWERANWFLPDAVRKAGAKPEYRYSWKRQNWFAFAAEEHKAVRGQVGLFDMTSFAKFRVEGRDAEAVLQRISGNDVAVEPGRMVYTQWLNGKGGIEADLTITRLDETAFVVVTGGANRTRDLAWLKRHIPQEAHCVATDISSAEAVLCVMGPNSRSLLAEVTSADLSNQAFPFGTAKEIEVGMAVARAHRISYVGELGWELYVPAEMAVHVFDAIVAAGPRHGLRLAGLHVLDSCRIEKAYRHFGHDISNEDHVLEAGLGFAVKTDKPRGKLGEFLGREAVLRKREEGLERRLVQFMLKDPEPLLFHNEPVWRDGKIAGRLTSASYGHHLGAAIGLGYVATSPKETAGDIEASTFGIEIAGNRYPARASLKPLYDPTSARLTM